MTKIATYGLADTPLQLSDRLIGTEAPRPTPSATPLATKNFSLGELLQLFSDNFPAATLQEVLDAGNTATQNIFVNGTIESTLIKPTNIIDSLGSQGTDFQVLSKSATGINWVDAPQYIPTLDEVLGEGNVSIKNAKVGNIYLYNDHSPSGLGYVYISGSKNRINFYDNQDRLLGYFNKDGFLINDYSSIYSFSIKKPSVLSDNHTATFQNTSGTIAYLADLPDDIMLTTIGTSGPSTLIGNVLNIPIYAIDGSAYVPYLGATNDVDLGLYKLKADSLEVSTTSTDAVDVGKIVWNQQDGTFDMGLLNQVTMQVGQELYIYAKASGAISNGDAVQFAGSQGDHILVKKAVPSEINSNPEYFIGVATQDFANNDYGYTTVFGQVRGLDTSMYVDGDVLYYESSGSVSGLLVNSMPLAPLSKIIVAAVVRSHVNQGSIFVRPHVMPKIESLQNVSDEDYVSVSDDDSFLLLDSISSVWAKFSWSNIKSNLKTYFDTIYTTSSAVASQISTALVGYATQSWVTSQGYITNVISALGFTPENVANKSTLTTLGTSDTLYPTQNAVKTYVDGNLFNSSLWVSDKLTKTATTYFTGQILNAGNTFGGSGPNTGSFKTMSGFGIMSGTNANGGARYSIEASNAFRPTTNLSFYSCFYLGNITRDNFIRIGFLDSFVNTNTNLVTDGFWLQINTANVTLNTANGGVSSQSSSTSLSAGLYYEMLLEYISSTDVRLKIKEVLSGAVIFNQTLTTNIPTTAKVFRPALIATITTAGVSTNIISLQEMSFGIKPSFLNNF